MAKTKVKKVIIMGAAGRDFHTFNTAFKNNPYYKVIAFTAAQIPNITGRKYPRKLAGKHYPKGIPIYPEEDLQKLIEKNKVDEVVFAYSDVSYKYVMEKASSVNAWGADFKLIGWQDTMLKSSKPVISVTAVRTGSGKSQTSRKIAEILRKKGLRVVVIRHPMPYGNLMEQAVQRFEKYEDFAKHDVTIEEREEYEPHIEKGIIVYAGIDYRKILRKAEKEADVIIWDGGNNDFSFYKSNLYFVVADPLRAGQELNYYPGSINVRLADFVIINKENSAKKKDIEKVEENVKSINSNARIIHADSVVKLENPKIVEGKKVLVVEDGPTLTHGDMGFGAGIIAAKQVNAKVIDAERYAVQSIKEVYDKYKKLKKVLPAMGYGREQITHLESTINRANCDAVVIGTPIDLGKILKINKPSTRVRYNLKEKNLKLESILMEFCKKHKLKCK